MNKSDFKNVTPKKILNLRRMVSKKASCNGIICEECIWNNPVCNLAGAETGEQIELCEAALKLLTGKPSILKSSVMIIVYALALVVIFVLTVKVAMHEELNPMSYSDFWEYIDGGVKCTTKR